MPIGATLAAAGTIGGAAIASKGANKAAKIGAQASKDAGDQTLIAQREAIAAAERAATKQQEIMSPYVQAGLPALMKLQAMAGESGGSSEFLKTIMEKPSLAEPFFANGFDISQLPGFEFIKKEGLEAAQNSFAARGLGSSGVAMEGGIKYAEDLASTYGLDWLKAAMMQDQANRGFDLDIFKSMMTGESLDFDKLMAIATLGQNSAAGVGSGMIQTGRDISGINQKTGQTLGDLLIGAGNAKAGGAATSSGAWSKAFGDIGQLAMLYKLGGFGDGAGIPTP